MGELDREIGLRGGAPDDGESGAPGREGDLIVYNRAQSRALQRVLQRIPLNDLGLPLGIYRIDLLPDGTPSEDDLSAAYIPLSYVEGFPTTMNGTPFWRRLEWESEESYSLFEIYLRQPELQYGARVVQDIPVLVQRELGTVVEVEHVQEQYITYYWAHRARSFDLFRGAALRRQQQLRSLDVQDAHYRQAAKLMGKLAEYMDGEDFWDLMTPKTAVDLLKNASQLQRLSVGLPAMGPPTKEQDESSFERTLRTLAQSSHDSEREIDRQSAQALEQALEDPTTTQMAQDLILKLAARTKGNNAVEDAEDAEFEESESEADG